MNFAIQINASPLGSHAVHSAYHFARAALQKGHRIIRIFFYQEGVYNALAHASLPDDECNSIQRWSVLAEQHGIDMVVCVSAAQRRGLIGDEEQALENEPGNNTSLAAGFRIGGLGQSIEAMIDCDRFVQFGGDQ